MRPHFGQRLLIWYSQNKRDLPWRNTSDPYKIWLSEIILQQTRVEQGLSYYQKFTKHFPTVEDLAKADKDLIYKMWQGLGYYNRADNMHLTAKTIVNDYNGKIPADYDDLLKLKGIGSYTAAAISSIAFNISKPVVDGNVFRVLSRIAAIKTPINSSSAKKEFETLASKLMSDHPPGEFNQALMEFGAIYCKPNQPDCAKCIFRYECQAYLAQEVNNFPVKPRKLKIKKRYFYYALIEINQKNETFFLLRQRSSKDIWKNLYDFPVAEFDAVTDPGIALKQIVGETFNTKCKYQLINISDSYQHQLTHQQINAVFIRLIITENKKIEAENSLLLVRQNEIINHPVSRLIERYLQDQNLI